MALFALLLGDALTLLGILGYVLTGMTSWTALIPAFLGLPISIAGVFAFKARFRKHAIHVALTLALLGLLGSAMGVPKLLTMIGGGEVDRPGAAISQSIMAVLCLVFVAAGVWSFIKARRALPGETPAPPS